ncbi:MAG TPA: hypothetical protein VLC94_03130 [Candidatus Acidoferrum sp.]|nr:hypothetical protein [Candidatus Acidoferrum sp.]
MVSPAREYSLEQYLLERLKFSGMQKENLIDLVNIIASLKNKYSIIPFAVSVQGEPLPSALTARYLMDSLMLNKLMNLVLDTPRLASLLVVPHGFPKATQFELNVTVGD